MSFISILVPTKDYKDGLIRLLKNLPKNKPYLKIIISDDSVNNNIENFVNELKYTNLTYIKNSKTLGIAKNWNQLLDNCKSKYFMFLHNDDFIEDKLFFFKLFKLIRKNQFPDFISIDTKVINSKTKKSKWHIHCTFRFILNKLFKKYILRRNYLGPASAMIIKNKNIKNFDDKLKWLIDVDFYYNIFLKKNSLFTNKINVFSESNHESSVTYSMKNKIIETNKKEFLYLKRKYNFSFFESLFFLVEPIFWIFIRGINLLLRFK